MNIDVFISHHTGSSHHIVEAISNKLESVGIRCWQSGKNLHGGDYASGIMEAIESCKVFLLVLNRPASESAHVLNELEIATDRLSHKQDITILPFHIADTEISSAAKYYIKRHHWIDAMDPPMWQHVDELAEQVMILLGREAVTDKGSAAHSYRLVSKMPQAREIFDGRDNLIAKIGELFAGGKRVLFLEGIGGIGKSELAKQYALRHAGEYDQILFVTFSTTLEKLMCDPLQIQIEGLERSSEESDAVFFNRKLQILRTLVNERTLIIVDNFDVDQDERLREFTECGARVIFTTRNAHSGYPSVKVTAIENMNVLMEIFEQNFGDTVPEEERGAVEEIFRMIEFHTYTIELIAKQMEASFLTATEMLEILKSGQIQDGLSETVAGRHDRKTAFGHICSVFNTSNLNDLEKQLLMYLSLMGTQGVQVSRFKEWAQLKSFETVNQLVRRSWIRKESGQRLSLHPLVKEVVYHELRPDAINCWSLLDKMTEFCYFAWFRPYIENLAAADNVLTVLEYFKEPDMRAYEFFVHFPNFLWQVGRFDESVHYAHIVYDACVKQIGVNTKETALAARHLGGCYFNSGREKESIRWYKHGLECALAAGMPECEELGMNYEKVARCYTWPYEQDFAKAEELFQISLGIRLRLRDAVERGETPLWYAVYEPYDEDMVNARVGEAYMEIGRMYQAMRQWEKAAEYTNLQLNDIVKRSPGNLSGIAYCHYDIGVSDYHMALEARENGNHERCSMLLEEAECMLKKALDSNMKMRGALAIDTIDNQEYLADVYAAQGRMGDASNAYMAVLTMVENLLGRNHPRIERVKEKMKF